MPFFGLYRSLVFKPHQAPRGRATGAAAGAFVVVVVVVLAPAAVASAVAATRAGARRRATETAREGLAICKSCAVSPRLMKSFDQCSFSPGMSI